MNLRRLLILFAAMLCSMSAWAQYAPVFINGYNFTCTYPSLPSNANDTYCDAHSIAIWQTNLATYSSSGVPCYTYPEVIEFRIEWTYDPYNGGIYDLGHDLYFLGLDTNSSATYPSAACPYVLTEQPPPSTAEVLGEIIGYVTQVNGNLNCQGGALHANGTGYPYPGSEFLCVCPEGTDWYGYWGTVPSGACLPPDVPWNVSTVIDPPCTRQGMSDHRTFAVPAGQKFALDIATDVGGTNFIPDVSSFVLDGKGRRMPFANGATQFHRIVNRQTGSWLMYSVFQMPTDVSSGQLYLFGESCTGPEVEYAIETYPVN